MADDVSRLEARIAAESAADRLLRSLDDRVMEMVGRLRETVDHPHPREVALVLRALADHTAIMGALEYRPDPTSPWPHATSLGRWYHDVADRLEAEHG